MRLPLTPTPPSDNRFICHSHAASAAAATAEANKAIDELLYEATQTIAGQAAHIATQEIEVDALRRRDIVHDSRALDLHDQIDQTVAAHDAEIQYLTPLGNFSQSQVAHVANIATSAMQERDEALQEAAAARDAAEAERESGDCEHKHRLLKWHVWPTRAATKSARKRTSTAHS